VTLQWQLGLFPECGDPPWLPLPGGAEQALRGYPETS
jgi:hypothetical protein